MFDIIFSMVYSFSYVIFSILVTMLITYLFLKKFVDLISTYPNRKGDYVLITGCDSGFGYMTSLALSQHNLFVYAGCLTKDGVERLNGDKSFRGKAFRMDITNLEDIENAKNMIDNEVKDRGLWCVINNAGVCDAAPFEWMCTEEMKQIMDINLWGTVNVTKLMLPLIKRRNGRVIIMGSIHGRVANEFFSAYSISKFALEGFADSLRYEMKPWNVSVHIIEPGGHLTGIEKLVVKKFCKRAINLSEELRKEYGDMYVKEALQAHFGVLQDGGNNPQAVVDTYIHVVLSRRPQSRYIVGFDAHTSYMMLAYLPTDLGDFIKYKFSTCVNPAVQKNIKE